MRQFSTHLAGVRVQRFAISLTLACLGTVCAAGVLATPAFAASTVGAPTVQVAAGSDGSVVLSATTDQPLSVLSVDLLFDPSLCSMITDQVLVAVGRADASTGPQSGGIGCPAEGRVRVVFFNLGGGPAIPAGDGPIAEWRFGALPDAAGGVFPLTVVVNVAQNGPTDVPVGTGEGTLSIVPAAAMPVQAAPALAPAAGGLLALLMALSGTVALRKAMAGSVRNRQRGES